MAVELRPLDVGRDLPRLAELLTTDNPEVVTVEQVRELFRQESPERVSRRTVAVDGDGRLVGSGFAVRDPWDKPGDFWVRVIVDPDVQNRGVGSLLYDDVTRFARERGATRLSSQVRDNAPGALRFAERRGFAIDRHIFESTLDLATFDEAPFAGALAAAEAAGFRFFSLADLEPSEEAQRRLYELNRATAADVPGTEEEFAPFEQFRKFVFEASWYRADGQLVAAHGDTWVGLAAVGIFPHNNSAYHMHSGVLRAYRGRGLAHALKLLSIRCAKRHGAAYIRTNNDSQNAPMLTVNRKFGYRPEPGFYRLKATLS